MTFKRRTLKPRLTIGGLALAAGLALAPVSGEARVFVGIGLGVPLWYAPPPVVYAPAPYYVPPVVYAAPPAPTTYISPQTQYWYYCDNPQGYYPYVSSCSTAWRQVTPTPPGNGGQ